MYELFVNKIITNIIGILNVFCQLSVSNILKVILINTHKRDRTVVNSIVLYKMLNR